MLKYHPDKGGDVGIFREVVDAYEELSDPKKRFLYDIDNTSKIPDIEHTTLLSSHDLIRGKKVFFAISRKKFCDNCGGKGGWDRLRKECVGCSGRGFRFSFCGKDTPMNKECFLCNGVGSKLVFKKVCRCCKSQGVAQERVVLEAIISPNTQENDRVVMEGFGNFCKISGRKGDVVVIVKKKK